MSMLVEIIIGIVLALVGILLADNKPIRKMTNEELLNLSV